VQIVELKGDLPAPMLRGALKWTFSSSEANPPLRGGRTGRRRWAEDCVGQTD